MIYFDEKGEFRWGEGKGEPDPKRLAYGTIFCHAPCMVRKEAYEAVGGYTVANNRLRVEDWDLWIRMYEKGYKGFILKEPLYKMRDDRNAYSRRKYRYRINEFLVGIFAVKKLKLNPLYCLLSVRPLIVGLLPKKIYLWLHRA
jgi:glycosyltransferase EpsE